MELDENLFVIGLDDGLIKKITDERNKKLNFLINEKYNEKEFLTITSGVINWEKQDESWNLFFRQVALIGLHDGEICHFS